MNIKEFERSINENLTEEDRKLINSLRGDQLENFINRVVAAVMEHKEVVA